MPTRVICPACGKSNRLPDDTAGERVLCLACGARLALAAAVPAGGQTERDPGEQPPAQPVRDVTDVPAVTSGPGARRESGSSGAAPGRGHAGRLVAVAAACLLGGGLAGAGAMWLFTGGKHDDAADLLTMKSEAEALAIGHKLEAAHAKYREFQQRAAGRVIKDPMLWNMVERAQVDQDRVYTLLLDRAQAANPPDVAIPKPGTGTTTRADDPWYWPRVGAGGRAEIAEDAAAAADAAEVAQAAPPGVAPAIPAAPAPSTGAVAAAPEIAPALPRESSAPSPPPTRPAAPAPASSAGATTASDASVIKPPEPTAVATADAPGATDAAGARPPARKVRDDVPTPPRWVAEDAVTDDQIGYALKRGVDHLLAQVKDGQIAPIPDMTRTKYAGRNAIVVYALLQAGRATNDPRLDPRGEFMGRMIDRMKSHEMERGGREPSQPVVYARSIRAAALALYNRPQDRAALKADAEWLIRAATNGAYTYDDAFAEPGSRLLGADARWERDAAEPRWLDGTPRAASALGWGDARAILCDGLHDGQGRELNRMKRPPTKRLPLYQTPPPPPGPQNRTPTPPGMGGPQRTRPGGYWEPPRQIPGRATQPPDMGAPGEVQAPWDNSNSQYGLLGVWAAAETGVEVPRKYWEAVQRHWETWQLKSGQWGYMAADREGYLPMTCGGVASLWVTYDWLVAPKSRGPVGRQTMSGSLQAGMKWLETSDNAVTTPIPGKTHYPGYDLFGLERVGLASGFKYFGSHDWYRELAAKSVATQFDNGAWGRDDAHPDGLIETSYQLLFLSHGRHPIFMNKLRFDAGSGTRVDGKPVPGYWANRPRDVANLTRFASREFERTFNWQVVDLRREWHDWLDCPVLFIASHDPPGMGEPEYAKLRQFAEAGGVIFTHADEGRPNFTRWVIEELVPKTFGPARKAAPLPDDHEIYSLHYDLKKPKPALWGVSNGSRLLLVHSPTDLAAAWQTRGDRTQTPLFRLGVHMFFYAAGKADFRNRIDSPYVPPAPPGTQGSVAVARVKYDGGDWDPEPGAWRRFANLFQWENEVTVAVEPTDVAALDAAKTPLAHLTGNRAVTFTDAQAAAVRAYVEAGGVLLIDPCGGSKDFGASVRDGLLPKAFPNAAPAPAPPTHPALTAGTPGAEPLALRLRPYAADNLKMTPPPLMMIKAGKGTVVLSSVDITTGLLGTNTLTIVGYEAPFAQAICWNLLEWTGNAAARR